MSIDISQINQPLLFQTIQLAIEDSMASALKSELVKQMLDYEQQNDRLKAELEQVKAALNEVAECRNLTLLGCSEYDDSDGWNEGPHTVERAHQLGAYRAFNQCADIADSALAKLQGSKE